MRGWRLVGRLDEKMPPGVTVPTDGIIGFSPSADGPLRPGTCRVSDFMSDLPSYALGVTGLTEHDYVFIATAIGEDAFRRLS